ncbi:PAS domain S-box protein [Candidatus Parcubacteria bacterium]|jgi:PAS domain S-box-containing protein|nr:PAS domain S-box protein [Candidatus Parcubacteria bacterium]MBT3949157.1 PAS domain S-box protein [Candidatus Parcubacteria bacterium]
MASKTKSSKTKKQKALLEERDYRLIVDNTVDVIMVTEPNAVVSYLSPSSKKLFGYNPKELIGKVPNIVFKEDTDRVQVELKRALRGKKGTNLEYRILAKNKKVKWIRHDWKPVFKNKKLYKVISVIKDITEQKKVENDLLEEKEKAQQYLKLAGAIIISLNSEGIITLVNKKGNEILGYKNGDLIGQDWFSCCLPKENVADVRGVFKSLMQGKIKLTEHYENPIVTKSGEKRLISWYNTFLKDDSGKIIGILSSGEDVTEAKKVEEDLKDSEEKYKTLAQASPDCIKVLDKNGRVVFINKEGLKEHKIKNPDKIFDFDWMESISKEDQKKVEKAFKTSLLGSASRVEIRHAEGKSSHDYCLMSFVPIKDTKGLVKNVYVVSRDVTEAKKAKKKLEEREKLYRTLFESTHDLIQSITPEGKFDYVNKAWVKKLGYSLKDIEKMNIWDIISPESKDHCQKAFGEIMKSGSIKNVEAQFVTKKGKIIDVEGNIALRKDNGNIVATNGFFRDITEKKRAEKSLKESENKFRDMVLSSVDWMWEVDVQGRYTFVSNGVKKDLGYTPKEIIGKTPFDFMSKEEAQRVGKLFKSIVAKKGPIVDLENRNITKKGKNVFLLTNGVPILDDVGRLVGYRGVDKNITERKKTEIALKEEKSRLDVTMESVPGVFYVFDIKGKFLKWNKNFEKVVGYSSKEMSKASPLDFFKGKDIVHIASRIKEVFTKGESSAEAYIVSKSGKRIPYYFTGKLMKIGGISYLVGVGLDRSEKKKAEEEIERYKFLADQATQEIALADLKGNIVYTNDAWAKNHGYKKEELIGKPLSVFHPKEELLNVKKFNKKLMRDGHNEGEIVHKRKDGTTYTSQMENFILEKDGEPLFLVGLAVDITEKKKIEEDLKESEEKYRLLYETSSDAIMTLEPPSWEFTSGNPAIVKMFGVKNEKEFTSLGSWQVSPKYQPDGQLSSEKAKKMIGMAMKTGRNFFEWTHKKVHGEDFFATVLLNRVEADGHTFLQARVSDITEKKKAEQALKYSEENYRTTLQSIKAGLVVHDANTNILFSNPEAHRILGLSEAQMLGKKAIDSAWSFVDRDKVKLPLAKYPVNMVVSRKKPLKDYLVGIERSDRDYTTWVIVNAMPVFKQKKLEKVIINFIDVTEREQAEEELMESEELLRESQRIAHVGSWHLDIVNNKLTWSDEIYRIFGLKPHQFVATYEAFLKAIHPDDRDLVNKAYADSLKNKTSYDIEHRVLRPNGVIRIVRENCFTIFDKKGKPLSSTGSVQDITDSKKAEELVSESEEKYRNVVERANDGIMVIQDRKIKYANSRIAEMVGVSVKEALNKSFTNFVHSSEIKKVTKMYLMRMSGKKVPTVYETVLKNKKGKKVEVELNAGLIDFGGKTADLVIVRDIRERKKSEMELVERMNEVVTEKDKVSTIVQGIGDGVFVVDIDLKITLFNPIASHISGFSDTEVIGKKYSDVLKFVSESDIEKINDRFVKDAIRTGEIQEMSNHTLLIDKNGEKIPVADSAAPLKDEKGNIIGCVVVFRDATKEREIDRVKSEFVSVASHQLRTPLSGIKWFTELLLKQKVGKLNDEQKDYVNQVHVSNERLIRLVSDLLDVSHIDTGKKFFIEKKRTDISEIISQVLEGNIALINKRKIGIDICKELSGKVNLFVDPDKIRQVFYNLITNAIKYSKVGGKIELCIETNKGKVVFSVKDKGLGIPRKDQDRIFEKFFRADNVMTTQTDGTGLGLYITKAIVEAHGGKVWFESRAGKGTTFFFSLPKKGKK